MPAIKNDKPTVPRPVSPGVQRSLTQTRHRHVIAGCIMLAIVALSLSYVAVLRGSHAGVAAEELKAAQRPTDWDRLRLCSVVPEYDRTLKRVVVSLAQRDTELSLHHEILQRLPQYTEIILLVPERNLQAIRVELRDKSYQSRVHVVMYDSKPIEDARYYMLFRDKDKLVQIDNDSRTAVAQQGSTWAQDFFEVTMDPDGRPVLLTSVVHKYFCAQDAKSNLSVIRDNIYLERLESVGLQVQTLPLAFMGGNILIDKIGGRRIAFYGPDILRATKTISRALFGSEFSQLQISQTIKDVLNVDQVVTTGRDRLQPELMYHLDQAMLLLPGGVAAITNIVSENSDGLAEDEEVTEARIFLTGLRATLLGLGYRLIDIDTSVGNLLQCQHYVNAIPYVDAETGDRVILMPVFPSAQTDFDKGIINKNTAAFTSLGYNVIHVPTRADELRGGIHCLVNVVE